MPAGRAPSSRPRTLGAGPVPRPRVDGRASSQRLETVAPEWFSRFLPPEEGGRESAVLILFGPPPAGAEDDGEHVVLIERSHTMRTQPAQIAFPGGSRDPEDDDLVATALREAEEETGVDPAGVDVVAQLPSLFLAPGAVRRGAGARLVGAALARSRCATPPRCTTCSRCRCRTSSTRRPASR